SAQHLVAAAEVHLGVLGVGEGLEAGVGTEVAGGPLPRVAHHLMTAEEAPAAGVGTHRRRAERSLVEVGVILARRVVAPRETTRDARLKVPRRRLLPLGLAREALSRPARVGLGLVPAHVDRRPIEGEG